MIVEYCTKTSVRYEKNKTKVHQQREPKYTKTSPTYQLTKQKPNTMKEF